MEVLEQAIRALKNLDGILSVSVIAAIILFILREIINSTRSSRIRKHKRRAIKLIVSHELEQNHFVFERFFSCLSDIQETEDNPEHLGPPKIYISSDGEHHIRTYFADGSSRGGSQIFAFKTSRYERLLPSIAELDEHLFNPIQRGYSAINLLSGYRKVLIDYLSDEVDEIIGRERAGEFLLGLLHEKSTFYESLNEAYTALGNDNLEKKLVY